MKGRLSTLLVVGLLIAVPMLAKNKAEKGVPSYILSAKTVAIVIDPKAGIDIDDPRANQVAQKDVETALLNWGRFVPVISPQGADLIIVIRKGHARVVDTTASDPRQNNRVGMIDPTQNGVSVGAQHGRQPDGTGSGMPDAADHDSAHTQAEAGTTDDSFFVYNGDSKEPLDGPMGWSYVAKDGLRSHNVPAVDEFKKAVAAADKAAAAKHP